MKISKEQLKQIIKEELQKELEESLKTKLAGIIAGLALFVPDKANANIFDDLFGEEPPIENVSKDKAAIIKIKLNSPIKSHSLRNKFIGDMAKKQANEQGIVYKTIMAPREVEGSNGKEYTVEFIR